jgi:hypothetical protein
MPQNKFATGAILSRIDRVPKRIVADAPALRDRPGGEASDPLKTACCNSA